MQAKKHWLWDQTGLGTSPDPATSHLYDLKQGHFKSDKIELYHSGEIAHAKYLLLLLPPEQCKWKQYPIKEGAFLDDLFHQFFQGLKVVVVQTYLKDT